MYGCRAWLHFAYVFLFFNVIMFVSGSSVTADTRQTKLYAQLLRLCRLVINNNNKRVKGKNNTGQVVSPYIGTCIILGSLANPPV